MLNSNLKVYYWSPHISKVATVKSVIHSALSLKKYTKNIEVSILNIFGEWNDYKNFFSKEKILLKNINIGNFLLDFKTNGYIISRLKYLVIFIFSLAPLYRILKKEKPNFLIVHLITSLPLFLFLISNFKTNLILRISGYPHLNKFRYLFWKIAFKKVYLIAVPTEETLEFLKNKFPRYRSKFIFLRDPVLHLKEINTKKIDNQINDKFLKKNNFFLTIGRLTKQKNFFFLIKNFHIFLTRTNSDYNLLIIGRGEDSEALQKYVKDLNLENRIFFKNYTDNVFKYLKNCSLFILSSLWEDPGFVLIEAAYMEKIIISSDCRSGPKEFLREGLGGFLYKSNDSKDFQKKLDLYFNETKENIEKKLIVAKRNSKNYTLFQHFIMLIPYIK